MFQIKRKIERFCREHNLTLQNIEQIGVSTFYVDVLTAGFLCYKQTWKVSLCGETLRAKLCERAAR